MSDPAGPARRRLPWAWLATATGVMVLVAGAVAVRADVGPGWWVLTVVVALTVVVGETWRARLAAARSFPAISLAACLAYAMAPGLPGGDGAQPVLALLVVAVTGFATLVGGLLRHRLSGAETDGYDVVFRLLVVGVVVVLFRLVPVEGASLAALLERWDGQRWAVAVVLLLVGGVGIAVHLAAVSARQSRRQRIRLHRAVLDEASTVAPLVLAVVPTAVVIALASGEVGPAAVPLFMAPLVLVHLAVGQQSQLRVAQRQTIRALSRLTEQGGFTPHGHADRVARLAVAMGRDFGLSERDLLDLEYAALLHDLGQVSLRRPIPDGATSCTASLDQARVAADGAAILTRTSDLSRIAPMVAEQAVPYHRALDLGHVTLQSRILKVANAFDDLVGPQTDRAATTAALRRLRLGAGHEYDPVLLQTLCRVLVREGRVDASTVASLDLQPS